VKTIYNIIMVAFVAGIIYLCYSAIMRPIDFNRAKDKRDAVVEQRLDYIRKAEEQYSLSHGGAYCNSWTELIQFVKTAKIAVAKPSKFLTGKMDTTYVSFVDSVYPKGFVVDSLKYVPFSKGLTFELYTRLAEVKRGVNINLLQVQTPYSVYLNGLDTRYIRDIEMIQTRRERYAGLRIGDIERPNGNEGNWVYN
jgi:hypothetical protein